MLFHENDLLNMAEKRDLAFQIVVALRDALNIAIKTKYPVTYEQALAILYDLDKNLYNEICGLISEKNENDIVKYFKEEATLQSITKNKKIEAEKLITTEIRRLQVLKKKANLPKFEIRYIEKRISLLSTGLINLKPRKISEKRVLNRTELLSGRKFADSHFFPDVSFFNYSLKKGGVLRIGIIPPVFPELICGADLIYQQKNLVSGRVRFVVLNYLTWERGIVRITANNKLMRHLKKTKFNLCDKGYCKGTEKNSSEHDFRFPYCCGFLRFTDNLKEVDGKMSTSGFHIPICSFVTGDEGNYKVIKSLLKKRSLNFGQFAQLFNLEFAGSRWLDENEFNPILDHISNDTTDNTIKLLITEFVSQS